MSFESSVEHLAVAIVHRAVELSSSDDDVSTNAPRLDVALLESDVVKGAMASTLGSHDIEASKLVLTRLAVSVARDVVGVWSDAYPDRHGPMRAVEAAEHWNACPCTRHAEVSALASTEAARQSLEVWRIPPKAAAWAARAAAWAADAPKYGWQSVAAIAGACHATNVERVVAAATRFLVSEIPRT